MLKKKHTIYSYIDQGLIEGVTNESLWESTQAGTIPIPIPTPTPMATQRKRIANQWINQYPRKILDWQTATECFQNELKEIAA